MLSEDSVDVDDGANDSVQFEEGVGVGGLDEIIVEEIWFMVGVWRW